MNMHAMFRSDARQGERADLHPFVPNTRRKLFIGIGVAAVLLVAALWFWLGAPAADSPMEKPLRPVTVIVPGRVLVPSTVSGTGSLAATRDMPVGVAGDGGTITAVLVDAGDRVAAGQVLARIDKSVQIQQARQMAANLAAARANADLAQAQLDRAQALVSRGFISRADIDQKTATRDAARAQVAVAQAQLHEMQARIARLDIRSPTAGVVLERSVEAGQVVGQGGAALFRVAKDGAVEMRALLAEQEIARLKTGMPAEVIPTGQTRAIKGSIWLLSPIVNPQTRQGEARIALPRDPAIRPGGFASVRIAVGAAEQPLLPESAVLSDMNGSYVMLVDSAGKVQRRPVGLGEISARGVAIASGLNGSEQVVKMAGAFLAPGDKVNPTRVAAR